jgi:histidyl-tRNA synthetase
LNSHFPESDVEVICLAAKLIDELGIKDYNLKLNSLGNKASGEVYRKVLTEFLNKNIENLSEESKNRIAKNPLRVLDSKNPVDIEIVKNAPNILDSLDNESVQHFEKVRKMLDFENIKYEISPNLVRGLDYYSHTVFEFQSTHLGSQDAFGGGGRYNSLFAELGGKETPAVGFAMGIERLLLILEQIQEQKVADNTKAMIILTDEKYVEFGMKAANILRNNLEISCILDVNRRSMKAQLREANKLNVKFALIIGDEEVANNSVSIKFMQENKEQKLIKLDEIIPYFKENK